MAIRDLCDAFLEAGEGKLTLSPIGRGCKMLYVTGPQGQREWQLLVFWGGHSPSNRQFIVNPNPATEDHLIDGRVTVRVDPVPPMGDLEEAARQAARTVLGALAAKTPA